MKKQLLLVLALALLAAACGTAAAGAPDPSDTTVPAGRPASIGGVTFQFLESLPVQVRAVVTGDLPTPCHTVVVGTPTTSGDRVELTITVAEPPADTMCVQVIEPFEETIDLGTFAPGTYTLLLNGTAYPFTI